MSIYIKSVDNPKGCYECKIWSLCFNSPPINILRYTYGKLAYCPIVEVPTPHGRLIDENWLFSFISTNNSLGATHYGCLTKEEIQLAPTVIEKEE